MNFIKRLVAFAQFAFEEKAFAFRFCPVCGSSSVGPEVSIDREGLGLPFVNCEECGMLYSSYYFSEAYTSRFYDRWYSALYGRGAGRISGGYDSTKAKKVLHELEGCDAIDFSSWDICDLGCGDGGLLHALPKSRRKVGFEFSKGAVDEIRKDGLEAALLTDLESHSSSFDLVLSVQVVEHVLNPADHLRDLKYLAKIGGYIFVEFPEIEQVVEKSSFKIPHCNMFRSSDIVLIANKVGGLKVLKAGVDFVLLARSDSLVDSKLNTRPPSRSSEGSLGWRIFLIRLIVKLAAQIKSFS